MAGKTASVLKTYFQKYAKPTAEQFAEFIDTLYEKAASILPQDTNSFNLGSVTKKWKDIYSSGEAFLTKITATGLTTLAAVKATVFYNTALVVVPPAANININLSSGNVFKLMADSDIDIKFSNFKVGQYKLIVVQDAAGGHKIRFTAPTLQVGGVGLNANEVDVIDVVCDGVNCYVNIINDYK